MLNHPWHSVDSSSWTSGFRYATVHLFDSQRGRLTQVDMRKRHGLLALRPLLASYGLNASDVINQSFDRDLLCGAAVRSWQRAEAYITSIHDRRFPNRLKESA
jgi:hypothetical protein